MLRNENHIFLYDKFCQGFKKFSLESNMYALNLYGLSQILDYGCPHFGSQ